MKKDLREKSERLTRRSFLRESAATVGGLTVLSAAGQTGRAQVKLSSFLDLLRVPDEVTAYVSFDRTLPAGKIRCEPPAPSGTAARL